MQQIYRHGDQQLDVYTTVFSPRVCRSRMTRHVKAEKVVVAVVQYRSRWHKELDLNHGDLIQVLFKEEETWWFGRLTNGNEGYFPAGCVEPLQGCGWSRAAPLSVRRVSEPVVEEGAGPCGCTSGRSTPKLLKNSVRTPLRFDGTSAVAAGSAASSNNLLRRVLAKSRRKSCPLLPHTRLDTGFINTAFQPD